MVVSTPSSSSFVYILSIQTAADDHPPQKMAATILSTAAPARPWCQRPTSGITQSRLCFLPLSKPSSASSPSSLRNSTVRSTTRGRLLVVSCLPSSPVRNRSVANKLYVSGESLVFIFIF